MEPRISAKPYRIDRQVVDHAAQRVGLVETAPCEEERTYIQNKGVTIFQWRLLKLFKFMFDQELQRCRQVQELQGWISMKDRVRYSGMTFAQRMTYNEEIAEHIFKEWANMLGIDSLYRSSRKADKDDIEDRTHTIDVCIDTYRGELKKVKNRKKYRVVEPDDKTGALVSVSIQGVRNSSGKTVYQRFVQVLMMLA